MKKVSITAVLLAISLTLCACSKTTPVDRTVTTTTHSTAVSTSQSVPSTTETTTTTMTTTSTATSTTQTPTTAAHSNLYIPDISVNDVIAWFNEVVLDAEMVNNGNATVVQKWTSPIHYCITGETTVQDRHMLQNFAEELNTIPGFPGMYEATDTESANLSIIFCPQAEFADHMGTGFEDMDGAVTFWYNGSNEIYNATICYRTDIDQYIRNSVLLEEIYNGLGPIQDTQMRTDSIIYANYSTPQTLTEVDWLILKLLYHPNITCGMTAAQCEQVIRDLYY